MAFCDRHGIPHSDLLRWAPEDRAKQLAYSVWQNEERADRCPSCGERHADWLDENGDVLRDAPKKVVASPAACGCELIDEAREQTKDRRDLRFRLVDIDDPAVGVTEGSL